MTDSFFCARGRRLLPVAGTLTLSLLLGLIVLAWNNAVTSTVEAAPLAQAPVQPPSARQGHVLYQENCAACHGVRGLGDGPTAAELSNPATALADADVARQATAAEWFQVVKEGRMDRSMPPWKDRLSDDEIWDVVAFAYSLHVTEEELGRGAALWQEQCAACHGDQGNGDGPQAGAAGLSVPDFADLTTVVNTSLQDWFGVTTEGRDAMPGFADVLAEDDRWAVLEYARSFSYRPLAAMALPKGDGRLVGVVENATPGAGQVTSITVTLRSFQQFDEMQARSVVADEEGRFVFDELPTDSEFLYLATAEYQGITFSSDAVSFEPGTTEREVTLQVWEASTTPGTIQVDLAQWFVEPTEGALFIGELYRISHDSDHVYIGGEEVGPGKQAVLDFDLPDGAMSLAIDGGEIGGRFVLTEDGVVDTNPLPPGQSQLLMRYLLPYGGTRAELAHEIRYPVSEFSVLVAKGPTVQADGLIDAGTQVIGQQEFVSFRGSDLPAGQPIRLELRGLQRSNVASASGAGSSAILAYSPMLLYGTAALAAIVVLGLLAIALVRAGRLEEEGAEGRPSAGVLAAEQDRLLYAIAELDDRFDAGELEEATYRATRLVRKRALLLVMRQLEESQGTTQPAGSSQQEQLQSGGVGSQG